MTVVIRPVRAPDLVAVRTQLVDTWHATYDSIYGIEKVRDITRRWHALVRLAEQIDQTNSVFLLAEDGGRVLASSYARSEHGASKLYRLYVHPTAQRRSLGRRLLAETFAALPQADVHYLEVEPRNIAAINFYETQGFKRTSDIPDEANPNCLAAYLYERRRTPVKQIL